MADDMNERPTHSEGEHFQQAQTFEPATAGGPDISTPNQYDARLGGGVAGRQPVPGSVPTPDRQPAPHGHGARNLLIAGGATIAGGAAIAAGFLGLDKLRSSDENPNINPSNGVPTQMLSTETATPLPTATEAPTAIPSPEPGPATHGKYQSVEEMPVSEAQKSAIKELTTGSDIQIITDKAVIAIEPALKTRPKIIKYYNADFPTSQLYSLNLNTDKFPDASQRIDDIIDMANYYAWKKKSGSQATYEEYVQQKGAQGHPFDIWGFAHRSGELKHFTLDDPKIVIQFIAQPENTNILPSYGIEYGFRVLNNVLRIDIFDPNPGGEGYVDKFGIPLNKYQAGSIIAGALAGMGANTGITVGGKFSLAGESQLLIPAAFDLQRKMMPGYEPKTKTGVGEGLIIASGSKYEK